MPAPTPTDLPPHWAFQPDEPRRRRSTGSHLARLADEYRSKSAVARHCLGRRDAAALAVARADAGLVLREIQALDVLDIHGLAAALTTEASTADQAQTQPSRATRKAAERATAAVEAALRQARVEP